MGMYVSELRSVPVGAFTYYAYLVDASGDGSHSKAIARALQELAVKSGTDALVVSGPKDLTYEVMRFLSLHASSSSAPLEHLFHEVSSLVISEGALQTTRSQVFVLPLILKGQTGAESESFVTVLVAGLIDAMRTHTLEDYCRNVGAESFELVDIKEGLVVATLRKANTFLELKPAIGGVGVNLNAVIEKCVGPSSRPLPGRE